MTVNRQMKHDIERWSSEKMHQFIEDCLMRYKLIGMSKDEALASVASHIMVVSAGMVATYTNATVLEVASKFAQLVVAIREGEGFEINLGADEDSD